MFDLQQSIWDIHNSSSEKCAFQHLNHALAEYGYTRNCYTLLTDHISLNEKAFHGLERSYPDDWMKYYNERNFYEVDPVRKKIFNSQVPFFWQDVSDKGRAGIDAYLMMKLAEDAGVADGIGIGFHNSPHEITGMGIARETPSKDKSPEEMASVYLLCTIFHERYRSFVEKPVQIKLSARECEVLHWASEGKADIDIGDILSITSNTVRFHWKNIFFKLNANSRTLAISKALRLNLINPQYIRYPTKVGR